VIGRHRTVQQDAAFGVRQIVDVAMKALSPGVNDTTTAVMCVDYLTAVLVRMGSRRISPVGEHAELVAAIARAAASSPRDSANVASAVAAVGRALEPNEASRRA
jgi:uncharacterized membrane protein